MCIQTNGGANGPCDAGAEGVPAANGAISGVTDGEITVNLGDIDADGTNDVVDVTPTIEDTRITWAVSTSSGTDACAEDWIDCNI